ncbi:PREDICTED: uncharacterized protein LOC108564460 [Nicrophorus vespilloides]|uniref:Uncharacterized protein LOC108564460 n=1 Tax=Nicrophorus vespilloides TaxID=110193 RepID=A0ABM1MWQ8_NICVS|nr:PREDICTED: uncharacterized protein LOC108564460 [Nicrophorus vespilloides]
MVFSWGDGKHWKIGYDGGGRVADDGGGGGGVGGKGVAAHQHRSGVAATKTRRSEQCRCDRSCVAAGKSSASHQRKKCCRAMERKEQLRLDFEQQEQLKNQIDDFKKDPEKMQDLNAFLDDVVEKAAVEATTRQLKKSKTDPFSGLQNGSKRIGASINKAKTSAKTFATRVFTAICNCTNSVKSAVINKH